MTSGRLSPPADSLGKKNSPQVRKEGSLGRESKGKGREKSRCKETLTGPDTERENLVDKGGHPVSWGGESAGERGETGDEVNLQGAIKNKDMFFTPREEGEVCPSVLCGTNARKREKVCQKKKGPKERLEGKTTSWAALMGNEEGRVSSGEDRALEGPRGGKRSNLREGVRP